MNRFRPALIAIAIVALTATFALADEGKRAFEISDYFRTAFVGPPSVSTDGGWVAFTVTRREIESGQGWSEIWMMRSDGSGLRQMTQGRHHDGSPVFSPDGKMLLYTSDRGQGSQLYVMPVDGGEAKRLTDFPLGLSGPVWSPDGKWIAAQSKVYPECGFDPECNATTSDSISDGPLTARMTDELLYRHWTSWREGRFTHVLLVDAATGAVVRDLTPGRWDSPTFSVGGGGFAFSTDSSELCVVSNHDRDQSRSTNSDLWLIPVGGDGAGGGGVNVTASNRGWDGHPVYSPSGRYIAYLSQKTPGYESDLYRIGLFDRRTKKTEYLTGPETFDNWITDLRWSDDERWLYFSGHETGLTPLYALDLEKGGKPKKIHADGSISGWEIASAGENFVYSRSRVGSPPELFSVPIGGGDPEQLTRFNEVLVNTVDIRQAEVMWVEGKDGHQIQVFVVKPHGFDPAKKYPLILNVHGGPQSPWKDRYRGDWQVYPGKGYVVAFPNPTGSAGFGQAYVDAISCDWGGRIFDELMHVTDALEALAYVDGERMGAMGWSYGGYMMMWFAGHTERFQALASMMGVYDLRSMWGATEELWFVEHDMCGRPWDSKEYERWSPSLFAEKFKSPTLVITGEKDFRVPYTQSLHFFTDLQVRGVPSRLVVYPNAGHWPGWYEMAFYYLVHLDWFNTWLGGEPGPWDPKAFLRNQVFSGSEENNED